MTIRPCPRDLLCRAADTLDPRSHPLEEACPGIAKPLAMCLRWEAGAPDGEDIGLWMVDLARAILKEEER